jgi:hypothetical protein
MGLVKKDFILLLILCVVSSSFSQNKYEYVGGIKLNDSLVIPYRITFNENKGEVKGFSVTDLGSEHETRSNIFGEYNEKNKTLSFREVGIVYTKSPVSQNDFCFLNTTIKNFVFGKTKKAKANFVGLFSDYTQCINGEILLNSVEKTEKRIQKVVTKINRSKKIADSVKQRLVGLDIMSNFKMNVLKKNGTLSVFTDAKAIQLTIFDGGKLDGDRVSIIQDGTFLLSEYEATKTKKVLVIAIENKKTILQIKAHNEGTIAPNTVIVEIDDGKNNIKALSNLKEGEITTMHIYKNK